MITQEQLAAQLHGREYPFDMEAAEQHAAKEAGLVVIFGASDYLVEIRGAVHDELDAFGGTSFQMDAQGVIPEERDDDWSDPEMELYLTRKKLGGRKIRALWCPNDEHSWAYQTAIPHATFDIVEDGNVYCRGIVFNVEELRKK